MNRIIVLISILVCSHGAHAIGLNTGADVLRACQTAEKFLAGTSDDSREAESCIHFLMGFDSGQSVTLLTRDQTKLYCQPKGSSISSMVSTTVAALEKDNTYQNAPAGIAVWKALSTAWPCE